MPHPRAAEPVKQCLHCGKPMERKNYNGRLEDLGVFKRRQYCDMECMGKAHRLPDVTLDALHKRAQRFRKAECERCGTNANIQVHHINHNPSDNSPSNLMTLCGSCHTKWHWEHGKTIPKRSNR